MLSDCRSLVDHLNVEVPARVQDKRLQIVLNALRQAIFLDDGTKTVNHYPAGVIVSIGAICIRRSAIVSQRQ